MNNYHLSRLILSNYKLFDDVELNFNSCNLAIFDGPNGYGKTSIFDAIELLLTGEIKRVTENSSIVKNEAYETNFIAKDNSKPTLIKAEFISGTNKPLVVAKVFPADQRKKSKHFNPSKINEIAITYILPTFETTEYCEEHSCCQSDIDNLIGKNTSAFFDLFYYIKQDERLDFLKRKEKDRMNGINHLFNVEAEKKELENVKKTIRRLKRIEQSLMNIRDSTAKEISQLEETLNCTNNSDIKYEKLFDWKDSELWDRRVISISDLNKKDMIINLIRQIRCFVYSINDFIIDQRNTWCRSCLEKSSLFRYFIMLYPYRNNINEVKKKWNQINFTSQQLNLYYSGKFSKIKFAKISTFFNINIDVKEVDEILSEINSCRKNLSEIDKLLYDLNLSRDVLLGKWKDYTQTLGKENSGQCLLCGYDWGSNFKLLTQVSNTKKLFEEFTSQFSEIINDKSLILKKVFESKLLHALEQYVDDNEHLCVKEFGYIFNPKTEVEQEFISFERGLEQYNITLNIDEIEDEYRLIEAIKDRIKPVSPEYIALKHENNFTFIFDRYFENSYQNVRRVTEDHLARKIEYIEYNYYNSTFEKVGTLKKQLSSIAAEYDKFHSIILPNLAKLKDMLKKEINKYQSILLKNIEIPFYLFTGRIMQSYQGGLGILIKESVDNYDLDSDAGLDSIRFISPSRPEHDVLYTLSSGQLSAVIISLVLALNKVFSNKSLSCILIDDPVQSMDDLNMVSFVELLRNEFKDRQIILSTHEDSFSRFIQYKYEKYSLDVLAINCYC